MTLPQNAQAIYQFLISQGLSPNAAAGIAGNIQRESGGNPESVGTGGNGLIGWTPPLSGAVTGNSAKDLAFQLTQVMKYIITNGSVADINAHAGTPKEAADYFESKYERAGIPALAQREQAAIDTANAAKSGNWKGSASLTLTGASTTAANSGGGLLDFPGEILNFFSEAKLFVDALLWITHPENWVRIVAFLVGVALLGVAAHALISVAEGEPMIPDISIMPVPV